MKQSRLRSDPEVTRAWLRRSRRPLPPVSRRRRAQGRDRQAVRAIVLDRDRGCRARGVAPGACGQVGGRAPLEVHELTRGAGRGSAWLDPDLCIAVCPKHHDWITEHPADAVELGLARRSGSR